MRRVLPMLGAVFVLLVASTTPSYAWSIIGRVYCDSNQNGVVDSTDAPMAGAQVEIKSTTGTFSAVAVTDANGSYYQNLPDFGDTYSVTLLGSSLPGGSIILSPSGGSAVVSNFDFTVPEVIFLVQSPTCVEAKCWLTGGGAKFSPVTGTPVAEHGPQHSFGGNVNPGCNEDSGEGGQWNHVAHGMKLHFQGWEIRVVRCGNVPGIPEGSESPVTPYNFIEFEGTGTLKGIHGNKVDHGTVQFWARAEDRNEPGSSGVRDGAKKDRYFLHVFDASGTLMLIEDPAGDGSAATVQPVTITDGNLQIHISSCELAQ
jgi:hypothetical protein